MIRLSKPVFNKKIIKVIKKILDSGTLVNGSFSKQFEHNLNKYFKTKNSIVVSSGTAALHLALLSLGISKEDEVIVPAYSYIATANVVENVGAKPVFVDININELCINLDELKKKINSKTKAIIIVHEFGNMCDLEKLSKICKKNRIKLIEDAACSFGSRFNNKLTGLFGDISCFSLHPRKILTSSEGGIIVTNKLKYFKFIKSYKNHGQTIKNNKIQFNLPGLNYRLSEIQSALGIEQLSTIKSKISHRRKIAKIYDSYFESNENIEITKELTKSFSNYQSYHILLKNHSTRNKLKNFLFQNKIESNVGAQAIPLQEYYKKKYKIKYNDFSNAIKVFKNGLVIPIGEHITIQKANFIAKKINSFF